MTLTSNSAKMLPIRQLPEYDDTKQMGEDDSGGVGDNYDGGDGDEDDDGDIMTMIMTMISGGNVKRR